MPRSINSHYFHVIGDKLINPIVGVYIPIISIPIKGGMTIPNIATFDHGTFEQHEPNPVDIPLNPGWLIGFLIMAYFNPHITG